MTRTYAVRHPDEFIADPSPHRDLLSPRFFLGHNFLLFFLNSGLLSFPIPSHRLAILVQIVLGDRVLLLQESIVAFLISSLQFLQFVVVRLEGEKVVEYFVV